MSNANLSVQAAVAPKKRKKIKISAYSIFREIYLYINIFFMVFPLLFMILSSTKTNGEFIASPFALPQDFPGIFLENMGQVFSGKIPITGGFEMEMFTPFLIMLKNTIFLTLIPMLFMLIFGVMAGYALGRIDFKGKKVFMIFLLIIQTVPFFGYIVPMYSMMDFMKLTDNLWGVVPVYVAVSLPMSIILFQGFFKSFPKSIEEAALIDGCGELQKFTKIVLPVSKGCIASLALINFMGYWNEVGISSLLLTSSELRTINIGVLLTNNQVGQQYYGYTFALLLLSALPNFIFFTIFQKNILQGVTLGAVKG